MILFWRSFKSQVVHWHGRRRKLATTFLGWTEICPNLSFSVGHVGGGTHERYSSSFGTNFHQRVFFSELTKSQPFLIGNQVSGNDSSVVGVYNERNSTTKFLNQVNLQRVAPELVTQKVEEHLLRMLADYNRGLRCADRGSDDYSIALNLLYVAAAHNENSPSGENIMPKLFSLTCQVMIRSDSPNAVDEVHRQISRLLNCHQRFFRQNDLAYNTHHVNDACSAFIHHVAMDSMRKKGRKLDYQRTRQINVILQRMEELYDDSSVALVADSAAFESYILFLCSQHKPQEAYEMLQGMVGRSRSHPVMLIPAISIFTIIINCFAVTLEPEKALSVIQWMLACQKEGAQSLLSIVPPPNEICFNALLHAYAMAGGRDSGRKAEQTLEWMQRLHETEKLSTKPDRTSFNTCINAWARSQQPDAPMHAEALLRRLVALHHDGVQEMPSEETFTSVMNAWANCSTSTAVDRVEAILDLMERVSEMSDQLRMSSVPYTVVIKAWEKASQRFRGQDKLKCADMAIRVLDRMEAKGISVSAETYNGILSAILETSALNAVFYFLGLEERYREGLVQLNTASFNLGLSAITALNRPDAVDKATSLLKRMFEYSVVDKNVLPSTFTFNIILKVLSRSSAPDAPGKAEALLQEMDEIPSVVPNFVSYLTCIIAWGRSDHDEKFDKVMDLVHRFVAKLEEEGHSEKSTAVTVFNAALSVCHHNTIPGLASEALNTACIVMSKLRQVQGLQPDQSTYSSWFRAVTVCVGEDPPPEIVQSQILNEFAHCVNDGLVTQDVVNAVQNISPHILREVAGNDESSSTVCISDSWSKNVKIPSRSSHGGNSIG